MENKEEDAPKNIENKDEGTPKNTERKSSFTSENFMAKLEAKIQESKKTQGETVKIKFDSLKAEIKEYFTNLSQKVQKQLDETRDSVLSKIEAIIERETGFVDWDKFKEDLIKKKEEYEEITDVNLQKQAFDAYYDFYNNTVKHIDTINSASYNTIDTAADLFKFDRIVLDKFLINFHSLCTVLESDFVTNVSFTANYLDPGKIRLEEFIQMPHPGVWCAIERIDVCDAFIVGGRDGKVSMYDNKTLRILDVTHVLNTLITCLLYIPQYKILLAGGADNQFAVRRLDGRNLGRHAINVDAEGFVTFLQFLEDEDLIVSIGGDPNIRAYNAKSLVMMAKIPTQRKGMQPRGGAIYFKDRKLLMVGFEDGGFQFFNMKTNQLAFGIYTEGKAYFGLAYNEATGRIFAHTQPNLIKVWKFKGERPVDEDDIVLEGEGDKPFNIKLVDKYLLSASNNEKVVMYDLEERKVVKKVEIPTFKAQGLLVLEKEGRIIVTSDELNSKIASLKLH